MRITSRKSLKLENQVPLGEFAYAESANTSADGMRYTSAQTYIGIYRLVLREHHKDSSGVYHYDFTILAGDSACSEEQSLALLAKNGYSPFEYEGHNFPDDYIEIDGKYYLAGSSRSKMAMSQHLSDMAYKEGNGQVWMDAVARNKASLADVANDIRRRRYVTYHGYGIEAGVSLSVAALRRYPELIEFAQRDTFPRPLQKELFGDEDLSCILLSESTSVDEAFEIFVAKNARTYNEAEKKYLANLTVAERERFAKKAGELGCCLTVEYWADCEKAFLDGLLGREVISLYDLFHYLFHYILPQESLRERVIQYLAKYPETIVNYYQNEYGKWPSMKVERDQLLICTCLPLFQKSGMSESSLQRIQECCLTYAVGEAKKRDGLDKMAFPVSLVYFLLSLAKIDAQAELNDLLIDIEQKFDVDISGSNSWTERFIQELRMYNVPGTFLKSICLKKVTGVKKYDAILGELLPECKSEIMSLSKKRARELWMCNFASNRVSELFHIEGVRLSRKQVKNLLKGDRRIFREIRCNELGQREDGELIPIDRFSMFLFGVPGHHGAIRVRTLYNSTQIDLCGNIPILAVELLRDILCQAQLDVKICNSAIRQVLGE